MRELRATVAIVRRHIDRRFAIDFGMQFALVCAIGYVIARLFEAPAIPIVVCGVLGAASAAERHHAAMVRRVSFFAMPLFGRQLARAHVVAPVLAACSIPLGYAAGAALHRSALSARTFEIALLATIVAVLVSLSSVFRDGVRAALYVAIAVAVVAIIAAAGTFDPRHGVAIAATIAVIVGFLALRAFGETLARYDPLP